MPCNRKSEFCRVCAASQQNFFGREESACRFVRIPYFRVSCPQILNFRRVSIRLSGVESELDLADPTCPVSLAPCFNFFLSGQQGSKITDIDFPREAPMLGRYEAEEFKSFALFIIKIDSAFTIPWVKTFFRFAERKCADNTAESSIFNWKRNLA